MEPDGILSGAILAGGGSRRMGRNKALLAYRGATFLQEIAGAVGEVVPHVSIIADDAAPYAFLNLPVHADIFRDCGPLGGIHAALTHAPSPATLIVSCDLPLVRPQDLRAIIAAYAGGVAVPVAGERLQPLCGVYAREFLQVAEEYLRSGEYSVLKALADPRAGLHRLAMEDRSEAFRNVNTPADYLRLSKQQHLPD